MATPLCLLACIITGLVPTEAQLSSAEHVYYGHVPTQTGVLSWVDELISGTVTNYNVSFGYVILDIVGLEDETSVEVWDIFLNQMIHSSVMDRFEKKVIHIRAGTYFKITASERIAALLSGGPLVFNSGDMGGTSTFYPSATGGFRGREFIFNAAPPTSPWAYSADRVGYNFYLMALEEADWSLSDRVEVWSASGHLAARGKRTMVLQSRVNHQEYHGGAGNDVVFHLTTNGDVEVSCCALGDFVAVPAITGGYVGRLFCAPIAVTLEEAGRTAAFIVVPLEEARVTIYDAELNLVATRTFTESEVNNMEYWYHELGMGRFDIIAESTGDVTFIVGQTQEVADIDHLGDDITFIGSKPNQEIRFYAPTRAVIFAPENLTATIDGGTPIQMAKDEFRLLDVGVHSIVADKHVIVEILAAGSFWADWGSYLIEPADLDVSFHVPEDFLIEQTDYTMYIAAVVIAVILVLAFFVMRRRRARRI